MAIGPVVTRGYGSFGNANLVVTRGYSSAGAVAGAGNQVFALFRDKRVFSEFRDKRVFATFRDKRVYKKSDD